MKITKMPLDALTPASYNPRKELKQGDPEYEKLKRSIETFGCVEPIVFNERTGRVVGGHQRLTVLKDLGSKEADCVVVDLDDPNEKALSVALNKISGDWDLLKLKELFSELDSGDYDMSATGFGEDEIARLISSIAFEPGMFEQQGDLSKLESRETKKVICPKCGEEFDA